MRHHQAAYRQSVGCASKYGRRSSRPDRTNENICGRAGFATRHVLKTKEVVENMTSRFVTIAASAGV
jgi:hypothetical protein